MKSIICLLSLMFSAVVFAADAQTAPAAATTNETPAAAAPAAAEPAAAPATETTKNEPAEAAGQSRGSVVRSIFTTGIKDREPLDKLSSSTIDNKLLFYFTELRDMSGQTATHRWEYDGKVLAEVKFNVRGPRWRVWSSKSFIPAWAGDWKVSVINGAGETISEEVISMANAPASNAAATGATETKAAEEPAAPEQAAPEQTSPEQPADAPSVLNP